MKNKLMDDSVYYFGKVKLNFLSELKYEHELILILTIMIIYSS